MRMTIKPGTIRLTRMVFVPRLTRANSKGEITVKLPKVSAQVVPYISPNIGATAKMRIANEAVIALRISILPVFISTISLASPL